MSAEKTCQSDQQNDNHIPWVLQEIIKKVREMKESVHKDYSDLHTDYDKLKFMITSQQEVISKLEETITTNQCDMANTSMEKIDHNSSKLAEVAEENKQLCKENIALKDRIVKIEFNQLRNNVIIMGMQEQCWENYETTKERVYDTIAAAMGGDVSTALETARKVQITCCNRVGRYQVNKPRPISVTFEHREDKINLLQSKCNLPVGVFMNEEYPSHMKKNRNVLRPILKLAKGLPDYRERTKLQGDKLIINGIPYGVNDLHQLPVELAAYKAAQKEDENTIVFNGELSPYSNFHPSPFTIEGQKFPTAGHWIQYSKAMFFGDSFVANAILNCDSPYEAKKLSYQINGADKQQWRDNGFDKCYTGVREKFKQNLHLHNMQGRIQDLIGGAPDRDRPKTAILGPQFWCWGLIFGGQGGAGPPRPPPGSAPDMLKTTSPKTLAEASIDRTWDTRISLRDLNALKQDQ